MAILIVHSPHFIQVISTKGKKITEELKANETCIVSEIKFASSGPVDSCVASMSAQSGQTSYPS